jgi:CheY-like chemotaxis protein
MKYSEVNMPVTMEKFRITILDDDKEDWMEGFVPLLRKEFPTAYVKHYPRPSEFFESDDFEPEPDVILLDVKNMGMWGPKIAIPTIRLRWPKVPIIMLSKKKELSDALDYFALGARGYIIKNLDTAPEAKMMFGNLAHEVQSVKDWGKAASLIRFLVEEYRPIKRILNDKRDIGWVRKKKTGEESILPDQIEFLQNIERMNDPVLSARFPPIISSDRSSRSYEIPFYRAKSLRRTLFELSDSDKMLETAQCVLRVVLPELKTRLFDSGAASLSENGWERYSNDYYLGKLQKRCDELRTLLSKLEYPSDGSDPEVLKLLERAERKLQESKGLVNSERNSLAGDLNHIRELLMPPIRTAQRDALLELLNAPKLKIGGKIMRQPTEILRELLKSKAKKSKFMPTKLGRIHGDLHFDNILVGTEVLEKPFIKLIDPRGFRRGADFAYDIGKLLHSCHGKYDMIDDGFFSIKDESDLVTHSRTGTVAISAPVTIELREERQGGGSRDTVTSYGRRIKEEHYEAFDRIENWLVGEFLPILMKDDPQWKIRSYLNEALHFCTMGAFHLERSPLKALTLYVTGVQLMNKLSESMRG